MSRKRKTKTKKVIDLDTLLDQVKIQMGEEFYKNLVESIDDKKWEYYNDGHSQGYGKAVSYSRE